MIEFKVAVDIKGELLKKILSQPGEVARHSIWSGMVALVEEVEARLVKEAPVGKVTVPGKKKLVNTISSTVSEDGKKGIVAIGAPWAEYVQRGTGIFGPFGKRIFPTTKRALFWPGAEHPYRSVKGQEPNPFVTRALQKTKAQSVFEDGVWGYLKSLGE